jgi:hypothetical protein
MTKDGIPPTDVTTLMHFPYKRWRLIVEMLIFEAVRPVCCIHMQ